MNDFKTILRAYFQDTKIRITFAITLLTAVMLILTTQKEETPKAEPVWSTSDDFIPEGFVLVPLELQNRDALNALVGGFAVVDLFTVSPDGQMKGSRVGRRLKLVRSPRDPQQFAALVPEDEAPLLLAHAGPLFAVIQSRSANKRSALVGKSKATSRIRVYQGDRL
jgi:hypothetical protein